jgi:hypothetical protein
MIGGVKMREEIHGFTSPSEYTRFLKYIQSLIDSGEIEETEVEPDYGRGEIYGGRWFRYRDSCEIWRLIPPDVPFKGLWELVVLIKDSSIINE